MSSWPRRLGGACIGVVITLGAGAADPGLRMQEIAAGVYLHDGRPLALDVPGHDDIANIGFIVGERCVAVVDSGGSVSIGRALRAAIAARTSLPVCFVINTHVHVDHVLGNAAFRAAGTHFVGHANLAAAMRDSSAFFVREYAADLDAPASAVQVVGPDQLVDGERELDLGGRTLRLRAWPTAHTSSDLSVLDLRTSTLWTGDLLFLERLPVVDGSVRTWLTVMDTLASLQPRHTIPGHGPSTDDMAAALVPQRAYLQALLDDVRRALAEGKSLQQTIDTAALGQQAHWLLWNETHPRNVTRAYQELEWE